MRAALRRMLSLTSCISCAIALAAACGKDDANRARARENGEAGTSQAGAAGASSSGSAGGAESLEGPDTDGPSAPAMCDAAVPTGLCIRSPEGNWVGDGKDWDYSVAPTDFYLSGSAGHVTLDVDDPSGGWRVELLPAWGGFLTPKGDPDAQDARLDRDTFDFVASGRGCNVLLAFVDLKELEFDRMGRPIRLALDYRQFCDNEELPDVGSANVKARGQRDAPWLDPSSCAVSATTGFCLVSPGGGGIGRGARLSPDERDGTFDVEQLPEGSVRVTFEGEQNWHFRLDPPTGQSFAPGAYRVSDAATPTSARLALWNDQKCLRPITGEMELLALELGPGSVETLAFDFELSCGAAPPERGQFRYKYAP